jgi:hypothetical protein
MTLPDRMPGAIALRMGSGILGGLKDRLGGRTASGPSSTGESRRAAPTARERRGRSKRAAGRRLARMPSSLQGISLRP